jgi:hypothetical protein
VIKEHGFWPGILDVVEYLCTHPRPGCYVRALPVPLPTKFIEAHEAAIGAILSVLPAANYDPSRTTFARRCGMKEDEPLLRGRFLCPELQRRCGFPTSDVTLPVPAWAALAFPQGSRVIACENKINFLALPAIPNALALFSGGGAGGSMLGELDWLGGTKFIYWGDLDPCGLGILAQIRGALPHTRSVLMDHETLRLHHAHLTPASLPPGS